MIGDISEEAMMMIARGLATSVYRDMQVERRDEELY